MSVRHPAKLEPVLGVIIRMHRWEEEHPEAPGWTWEDVRAAPSLLMRMVVGGTIEVIGDDDRGRHLYRTSTR